MFLQIELVDENAKMPTRANASDAGCDVYTPIDVTIPAGGDVLIPLGWRCKFPEGSVMIMKEKSGVATKKKLDVGACVIDAGYRGIVHVHLFNNHPVECSFTKGDKVAQFIITNCWTGQPMKVNSLDMNTDRGEGGFGSTGEK